MVYAIQRFWFLRAWHGIGTFSSGGVQGALRAVLIGMALALLVALLNPLFGRFLSRIGGRPLLTVASLWLVTSLFAFLAVKSVGGVEWIASRVTRLRSRKEAEIDASRRNFFRYATFLAGGLPFLAATYGFAAGRLRYTVERVDVPIANLPPELHGLRIAQLSDIHIGDYMPPEEIARAVDMANDLEPHLSVVTGDFINGHGDPLDICVAQLSRLRAPLGVWGCNGNHEIYAEAEADAQRLFSEKGMRLLRGESAVIAHRSGSFNLIGVDYQRDHMTSWDRTGPMLREIEHLVRRDMPNILLSHNPNSFPRAAELGIELSLAGHTHGGQVKFEIVDRDITPARLITPFVAGLYHLPMGRGHSRNGAAGVPAHAGEKAALYVNRGLGTLGFPVRLGAPPEITLLTLKRT